MLLGVRGKGQGLEVRGNLRNVKVYSGVLEVLEQTAICALMNLPINPEPRSCDPARKRGFFGQGSDCLTVQERLIQQGGVPFTFYNKINPPFRKGSALYLSQQPNPSTVSILLPITWQPDSPSPLVSQELLLLHPAAAGLVVITGTLLPWDWQGVRMSEASDSEDLPGRERNRAARGLLVLRLMQGTCRGARRPAGVHQLPGDPPFQNLLHISQA
ncbi:hypothetical protein SKAU_G00153860 [Synaphobranchus kaupii]|uniref:Uncharacterized protein n=1 Tax=Synaphobranchus kaupii TaxID=118154 RepID=A0A9Q1IY61_SYNKA|nr:hypothetical protein SKAU_G00153860 [Synaphobranchus kaupii]